MSLDERIGLYEMETMRENRIMQDGKGERIGICRMEKVREQDYVGQRR